MRIVMNRCAAMQSALLLSMIMMPQESRLSFVFLDNKNIWFGEKI